MVKLRTARFITALIVILVILLGAVARLGCGTLCSLDAWRISFICPLGFLQMALASRKPLVQMWLSVALVLLSIVILGRFFCAWICPSALLQGLFGRKRRLNSGRPKRQGKATASMKLHASAPSNPSGPLQPAQTGRPWASYSRYAVLGGALLSSFLFGFPVFCLVCPIGLFFGSLFAVYRLFVAQQPTLELLLFPALLGLELFALKSSWCRSICPLGALLSIVGSFHLLRPVVKKDLCLASQGVNCRVCQRVCPEEIELVSDSDGFSLKDCTTCLECYEKCPAKAVKLTL